MTEEEEREFLRAKGTEIERLLRKLMKVQRANARKRAYYERRNHVDNLRIAIPRQLEGLKIALSWAPTAVDVLSKRITLSTLEANDLQVTKVINQNALEEKFEILKHQALIYGCSYLYFSAGDISIGEPSLVLTVENPSSVYGETNPRSNDLKNMIKIQSHDKDTGRVSGVYFDREYRIEFTTTIPCTAEAEIMIRPGEPVKITSVSANSLRQVPAIYYPNNPQDEELTGKSEITKSIMSNTDAGLRTLLQGTYAAEIYAKPQRLLLNLDDRQYNDLMKNSMDSYISSLWALKDKGTKKDYAGNSSAGNKPEVHEFSASSPAPYVEWIKVYAQQISGETGLPLGRLGYPTSNPQSAEAINAEERELTANAKQRIKFFTSRLQQTIGMIGKIIGVDNSSARIRFENPQTVSFAQSVDGIVKLASNRSILRSKVLLRKAGLSDSEIEELQEEWEEIDQQSVLSNLAQLAAKVTNESLNDDETPDML